MLVLHYYVTRVQSSTSAEVAGIDSRYTLLPTHAYSVHYGTCAIFFMDLSIFFMAWLALNTFNFLRT